MSTEKKARSERKLTDYSGKSDKKHVYDIPDTYVGSAKKQKFWTNVLNIETNKFEERERRDHIHNTHLLTKHTSV